MISDYVNTLSSDYTKFRDLCETGKENVLEELFAKYRAQYRNATQDYLRSHSRCASSMICGPANFPVARMQKRNAVADRRASAVVDCREKWLGVIRKAITPPDPNAPIMADDPDAVPKLRAAVERAEKYQEHMKANRADYMSWELSNNAAEVRRLKKRLAHVEKCKACTPSSVQGAAARIEDSPAENRVRLFFDGKPDRDTITALKRAAFRWTPSLGCWQAYRNANSLQAAKTLAQWPLTPAAA